MLFDLPQLRPHCVYATAHEALHLQVLFDPLEEQLHLPPLLVQCRHRGCRNIHRVGQKLVFLTSRFIQKADCPEHALHSSEPDFPVFQDIRAFAPPAFRARLHRSTTLQACDEMHAILRQLLIPLVIRVAPVKDHPGTSGKTQFTRLVDLVDSPCRHIHEAGQIAVRRKPHMQLHRPLAGAVRGPAKQRQRQLNHRGIKEIDLAAVFEAELLVGRRKRLTTSQKRYKHLFEQLGGCLFISPRQTGTTE